MHAARTTLICHLVFKVPESRVYVASKDLMRLQCGKHLAENNGNATLVQVLYYDAPSLAKRQVTLEDVVQLDCTGDNKYLVYAMNSRSTQADQK